MTENVQESGQRASGAVDQPGQQQASGATGDQQPSGVEVSVNVPALLQNPQLIELIDKRAERQWQSGKDRRIGQLEQRQDTVESVVAEFQKLTGGGMDPDAAVFRMKTERFMGDDQQQQSAPLNEPAGPGAQTANMDIAALLGILNLDANDPEIVTMLRTGKDSANDFTNLALSRKAQAANPPNPAGVMPTGGGGGGQTDDQTAEAIVARMQVLQKDPTPSNMETLKELDKQLADLM